MPSVCRARTIWSLAFRLVCWRCQLGGPVHHSGRLRFHLLRNAQLTRHWHHSGRSCFHLLRSALRTRRWHRSGRSCPSQLSANAQQLRHWHRSSKWYCHLSLNAQPRSRWRCSGRRCCRLSSSVLPTRRLRPCGRSYRFPMRDTSRLAHSAAKQTARGR